MSNKSFILKLLIASVVYIGLLAGLFFIFSSIDHWYWKFEYKSLPYIWLFLLLVILIYIIIKEVLANTKKLFKNFVLLILLGFVVQISFGLMEGRGMAGISDRLVFTGHAAIVYEALGQDSVLDVASNYQGKILNGELRKYPNITKPPGQILFYMATEKIAGNNFFKLASFLYPLLAYLVIIPLYYLVRLFLPPDKAILAPIFYLFVPNVTLMTMHLEQFWYPLLAVLSVYLFLRALYKKKIIFALLAGLVFYIGLYFSFSLIALLPFLFLILIIKFFTDKNRNIIFNIYLIFLFCLGFIILYFIFNILFNYNAIEVYSTAMLYHQQWKFFSWGIKAIGYYGFLNIIEFCFWVGFPLIALFVLSVNDKRIFSIVLLKTIILLAFFSKTALEVGRLWMFLVPFLIVGAVFGFEKIFAKQKNQGVVIIIALQLITILGIKIFQDFF